MGRQSHTLYMADPNDGNSRSSGIDNRLESSDLPQSVFREILDLVCVPVFVISHDRHVMWMNRKGRSLIDAYGGISLVRGKLRGETAAQSSQIGDLIDGTADPGRQSETKRPVLAKSLPRGAFVHPLQAVAVGLRGGIGDRPHSAVTALFVGDLDDHSFADGHLLSELFGFTPAEARIAAGLANGTSLDDLAADLGIGLGTVRWHVKRLMANTNTRRQAELIRLLLLSPLALITFEDPKVPPGTPVTR